MFIGIHRKCVPCSNNFNLERVWSSASVYPPQSVSSVKPVNTLRETLMLLGGSSKWQGGCSLYLPFFVVLPIHGVCHSLPPSQSTSNYLLFHFFLSLLLHSWPLNVPKGHYWAAWKVAKPTSHLTVGLHHGPVPEWTTGWAVGLGASTLALKAARTVHFPVSPTAGFHRVSALWRNRSGLVAEFSGGSYFVPPSRG